MTAKVDHLARLLETPEPAEVLRSQIDRLVAELGEAFPAQKLSRVLVAKSIDISIEAVGAQATAKMIDRALDLLAGRWCDESIDMFINQGN